MATQIHENNLRRVKNPSPDDRRWRTACKLRSGPQYPPFPAPFSMVPGRCFGRLIRRSTPKWKCSFSPFGRALLLLIPLAQLFGCFTFLDNLCRPELSKCNWNNEAPTMKHMCHGGPLANCDRDRDLLRFGLHFGWFQGGVLDASYGVLRQNQVLALSEEPYFSLFPYPFCLSFYALIFDEHGFELHSNSV